MNKKIFSLLMVIVLMSAFTINVYAKETEEKVTNIGIGLNGIESQIELFGGPLPCPSSPNGLHGMQGRGMGNAYDESSGNLRIQSGFASQCIYCNLIMITENNPFQTSQPAFGNYALRSSLDTVSSGVVRIWTNAFGYSAKNSAFSKNFQFIRGFRL